MFQKFQTFWDYCPFLIGKYGDHLPITQALKVQACMWDLGTCSLREIFRHQLPNSTISVTLSHLDKILNDFHEMVATSLDLPEICGMHL